MSITSYSNTSALHSALRFMGGGTSGAGWQRPGPVFNAEDGAGGTGGGAGGGEGGGGEGGGEGGGTNKPTDEAAKLLREVMDLKKKLKNRDDGLKAYEGVTADEVKQLKQEKADREAAAAEAEQKRLKDAGEFDKLKAQMATEHERQLKAEKDAATAERQRLAEAQRTIEELTVGSAFASSSFITENTVLTPSKARRVYGDHFDTENGLIKPYDHERGHPDRKPLVDAQGSPLPFDEAMKRIIEADPEKDRLLRGKANPGSGLRPSSGRITPSQSDKGPDAGVGRIKAGLGALLSHK